MSVITHDAPLSSEISISILEVDKSVKVYPKSTLLVPSVWEPVGETIVGFLVSITKALEVSMLPLDVPS